MFFFCLATAWDGRRRPVLKIDDNFQASRRNNLYHTQLLAENGMWVPHGVGNFWGWLPEKYRFGGNVICWLYH